MVGCLSYFASNTDYFVSVRLLRYLLLFFGRGAEADVKNKKGRTPFWMACHNGSFGIVELLVDHGANVDMVDNKNTTPLMAALRRGHLEVGAFCLLCNPGMDFNLDEG